MSGPQPASFVRITSRQRKLLKRLLRRHQTPQCLVWRIEIVLRASRGESNSQIARKTGKDRATVRLWRARWAEAMPALQAAEDACVTRRELTALIQDVLSDAFRSGSPGKFTAQQLAQVIAVACEPPGKSDRPISHWTTRELADPAFTLERLYPTKEMKSGLVERREFAYIRHGTRCLTVNFEVATGRIITPTVEATRKEVDFAAHIQRTVATDPEGEWIFIVDRLNTHRSETLVRWVAEQCALEVELGKKGKSGIVTSVTYVKSC